jgi:hypothetical protein
MQFEQSVLPKLIPSFTHLQPSVLEPSQFELDWRVIEFMFPSIPYEVAPPYSGNKTPRPKQNSYDKTFHK